MFWTIFLFAGVLIGIGVIGMGIQTFFTKKKSFPETRVGHSRAMRKQKIFCVKTQQAVIDKNYKQKVKTLDIGCASCE